MPHARQRLGARGEDAVARWYVRRGYAVVHRNWRCANGELDLVLRRGRELVVCEVKTRSTSRFGSPFDAVTADKQRRIRRLVAVLIPQLPFRPARVRLDVAAVTPEGVEVLEGAF